CVFIVMLRIRMLKEKTAMEAINKNGVDANPIPIKARAKMIKEASNGMRLLKRETSQPEMGKPISDPTGIVKSILPNSASFRSNMALRVGILEAQVEKQTPVIKKHVPSAMRCFTLSSIFIRNSLQIS